MAPPPGRTATFSDRASALAQRRGVRELVKFCLVGATSTVIDKGTLWILVNDVLPRTPWWVSATFRARDHARARRQYSMFLTTNLVGLGLNLLLTKAFLVAWTGRLFQFGEHPEANAVVLASVCAVPFVVLWNFVASKYWTFKPPA